MKQSLQLKIGQHLTMTPQLQQAIRLLQLSSLELNAEVQEVLESNMMLEVVDDEDGEEAVGGTESATNGDEVYGIDELDGEPEPQSSASEEIPEEMPVDSNWDDVYDSLSSGPATVSGDSSGDYETARGGEESLQEHLLWQLRLMPLNDLDYTIAYAIIDSLNADGFLDASFDDLRLSLHTAEPVEDDEIMAVLKQVQHLDPVGIAARDLRECLLLQLAQCTTDLPFYDTAVRLCQEYFDILAGRDYALLMRRLKVDEDGLKAALAVIQSLNPRPASSFGDNTAEYVVPDVFVRKEKGRWKVELNPDVAPQLRVNPYYASMIKRADSGPDNSSLKAHLQEARWFIKSLQSRSDTLLRVATAIVERQRGFLEHGEEAMKPLVLHDIADVLEMHESTISRVTTRKYMHTPRGIFELKYFFSSHVGTKYGGEAAATAVRAVIKKLIAAENARKPLSDSKIAALLSDQGIEVARRTVAKYREAMQIPPSNERKRLA